MSQTFKYSLLLKTQLKTIDLLMVIFMPIRNPALFTRIFNTPLMISGMKLDAIIAGIGNRFGIETPMTEMALIAKGEIQGRGYQVVDGVGVIDIIGIMAHRGQYTADCSYIMGYSDIGKNLQAAVNDPAVKAILLQLDSPGGEVSGAFELAQQIRDASQIKPVRAVVSSLAASAGYLLASAAQEISISDTGVAGSIGVVMRHVDISKMAEKEGVSVTYIYAGAQKIDGHQFAALPADVKTKFQTEIDGLYTLFVDTVAAYRGLDVAAIRAQEAGIYRGQDAIQAGLADRIATPDQLLIEMQQTFTTSKRGISMSVQNDAEQTAALEQSRATGYEAGKQDGLKVGAEQERARISAILNHEHAAGREAQAKVLAVETGMSAEEAGKVLAVSPVAVPAASAKPSDQAIAFALQMANTPNPQVGATGGEDDPGDSDEAEAAKVVALFQPKARG